MTAPLISCLGPSLEPLGHGGPADEAEGAAGGRERRSRPELEELVMFSERFLARASDLTMYVGVADLIRDPSSFFPPAWDFPGVELAIAGSAVEAPIASTLPLEESAPKVAVDGAVEGAAKFSIAARKTARARLPALRLITYHLGRQLGMV